MTAPRRHYPVLEVRRVHRRQPCQRIRLFTPAYQGSELLHIGKGLAHSVKTSVEAWTLDLRFCGPSETALVIVDLEFEFLDEHHCTTRLNSSPIFSKSFRGKQPRDCFSIRLLNP